MKSDTLIFAYVSMLLSSILSENQTFYEIFLNYKKLNLNIHIEILSNRKNTIIENDLL